MRKIVLTFGLISGAIISAMMFITIPFQNEIGFERGAIVGYTSMVLAFLLIYFGVRSYRDNVAGGTVTFGRAFKVGALISVVAAIPYFALQLKAIALSVEVLAGLSRPTCQTVEREARRHLMAEVGRLVPVLPVPLVATLLLRGQPYSLLELKAAAGALVAELQAGGAHLYVPRGDWDYAIDAGLRMLVLRHLVEESDGVYRANAAELHGRFVLAAGEGSGKLAVYQVEPSTGRLTRAHTYDVGKSLTWVLAVKPGAK